MKIYSNKFSLTTPVARQFYVSPNSIYAFGIKFEKNGTDVTGNDISVFIGSTALEPMGATVDGYTLYQRTSSSEPTMNRYDVVYSKDGVIQHFELIENITNSTVFDIDQEGGAMELPIASESVLGGVKVGEGLKIEADGKLDVNVNVPTKTSDLENDSSFISAETDPVFNNWLSGTQPIALGKDSVAVSNIDDGNGIAIGQKSNAESGGIAIGSKTTYGSGARAKTTSVSIGTNATTDSRNQIAIGNNAKVSGNVSRRIQLGEGTNANNEGNLKVFDTVLLDVHNNIPEARLGGISTTVLSGTYDDDTTFSFNVYVKSI